MSTGSRGSGPSRREFLKGVSAAGAGLVAGSVGAAAAVPSAAVAAPSPLSPWRHSHGGDGAPATSVDFGRIFPDLPPFADATETVRAALLEVGQQGGILDANDDLAAGPKALILDRDGERQPDVLERVRDQSG